MDAVQYHDWLVKHSTQSLIQIVIGDEQTNALMKRWLEKIIQETEWQFEQKGQRVLEVMAGIGRNYEVLARWFEQVEMLDGSQELSDKNEHPVVKYVEYIQKFKWKSNSYDAVVGVFCLCYLTDQEIEQVVLKMEESLTEFGNIVLMEPVLMSHELVDRRQFKE